MLAIHALKTPVGLQDLHDIAAVSSLLCQRAINVSLTASPMQTALHDRF
jgi:hypothetical protein